MCKIVLYGYSAEKKCLLITFVNCNVPDVVTFGTMFLILVKTVGCCSAYFMVLIT